MIHFSRPVPLPSVSPSAATLPPPGPPVHPVAPVVPAAPSTQVPGQTTQTGVQQPAGSVPGGSLNLYTTHVNAAHQAWLQGMQHHMSGNYQAASQARTQAHQHLAQAEALRGNEQRAPKFQPRQFNQAFHQAASNTHRMFGQEVPKTYPTQE